MPVGRNHRGRHGDRNDERHPEQRILNGEELGPVMDDVLGETEVRQKGGAIGALTAGLVMRREAFALGVAYALAPFVAAQLYERG